MATCFNVHDASGYDRLMGRWSRRLAPFFIEFAGLSDGDRVLDVGCGTGSLTFALADIPMLSQISAIDASPIFVEAASRRNLDQRVSISQADACELPFTDDAFDRAMALLVLHFVSDPAKAVSEMRRVTRPGGVIAAAVWDHYGGMHGMRMMVDTVAAMGAAGRKLRAGYCFQPMTQPGELESLFEDQGLDQVTGTELMVRMDYRDFADYWEPIAAGEGPLGKFMLGLNDSDRTRIAQAVRDAYEAGQKDGPRSFASVAWAVKGVVT